MAKVGPQPIFTDSEWQTRFLAMVHIGMPAWRAAEACGVHRATYFMWARKGGHPDSAESQDWVSPEEADPVYRDFIMKVLEEEAGSLHKVTETVYQKAEKDGEFGLKFLRHRWPEHWSPTRKEATPPVVAEQPILVQMTVEEFRRFQKEKSEDEG